ncbi:MAG TPA: sigma-70 family RNA polymerase sigma factor, partial [Chthoniobacterales bacterium]|nr:sigma-70 family RNA polymerase sigma factor [Chthoniobacterales bacterium]
PFAPTHWTVVFLSAKNSSAPQTGSDEALASLCRTYWPPLYTFVRRRGYGPADAQDLTQDFFIHLLETDALAKVDPKRGRFRTFLLAALKNFLANEHERRTALKRGGAFEFLPLDSVVAETETAVQLEGDVAGEEDRQFEQRWATALVRRALDRLRTEMASEGKERLYDELQVFVTGAGPLPDQAATAARLGIPFATLRTHIRRLRERYRDALRAEVARTVATPAEVDDELRHLCQVLAQVS